jgi:hypothetical protein
MELVRKVFRKKSRVAIHRQSSHQRERISKYAEKNADLNRSGLK